MVAPGSRSTPLAVALAHRNEIAVHIFHDERSASFAALGIALAQGRPAILLCTSGTAATHFHGAVVEAHQSNVPIIVCTADRPPELRDVGAPQTIDQTKLAEGLHLKRDFFTLCSYDDLPIQINSEFVSRKRQGFVEQ